MRLHTLWPLAFLLVAGCAGPGSDPGTDTVSTGDEVPIKWQAPWWPVGSSWRLDQRFGEVSRPTTVVTFWNDTATTHFWLGVADSQVAFDHALNDTQPLLGRIHWRILTPHEGGDHAAAMYGFPIAVGEKRQGHFFARTWDVDLVAGTGDAVVDFRGTATDGATIAYNYVPDLQWFSFLEIRDAAGHVETRIDVREHRTDAHGTYYFYRGRDYYEPTTPPAGGTEATFQVKNEDNRDPVALALKYVGSASGLLHIEILDPSGTVRYSQTLPASQISDVTRIPSPALGTWTVRYTGTGTFTGDIKIVGLLEFRETI